MLEIAVARVRPLFAVAAGAIVLTLATAAPTRAFVDVNRNKIDDRLEHVDAAGWNAAFENSHSPRSRCSASLNSAVCSMVR